jgi:hypothetical protein
MLRDLKFETARRFLAWSDQLGGEAALPVLVIGTVGRRIDQPVICCAEDLDDDRLLPFLELVCRTLRNGRREPVGPVLARIELRESDPAGELRDALAGLGTVLPLEVIRSWSPDQFFAAVHYCRRMQARPADLPDVPARPEFIP